jgi:CBS-domain-containing membrane protein
MATPKPLLDLTASDLMSRTLVVIPQEITLQAAGHLLSQARVSGAPVVDAAGRCIGVLSATDFIELVWKGQESAPRQPSEENVRAYMTADPVMVPASTPLGELAQMMLDAHIHRVIVAHGDRKPVGVVSTTDILAAVASAARQ